MGTSGTSADSIVNRRTSYPLDRDIPAPDSIWRKTVLRLDEDHHPLVRLMAIAAEQFTRGCLRDNRSRGHWLTICGQTGGGKSHTARKVFGHVSGGQITALGRWIMRDNLPAPYFIQWPIEVRRNDREWDVLMSEMVGCHLVVVDDIGAEIDKFKSGEAVVRLWEVLEKSKDRWLLLTTNVRPLKWRETFGQRCSDRMLEGGVVDVSDVPSYRTRT